MNYKKHLFILICALTTIVTEITGQIKPDVTYAYAYKNGENLYMDIYEPSKDSETTYNGREKPTILYVFGGGFMRGSRYEKGQAEWYEMLTENGFRVVAIDYRLGLKKGKDIKVYKIKTFENAIRLAVEDLFSATKFIIKNGETLGINPNNLVISGSSAGAITVLQADYELANRNYISSAIPAGFKYRGVISFAGALFSREGKPDYESTPSPTLLLHGTKDKIVTYKKIQIGRIGFFGSDKLAKRLKKYSTNYSIFRYKDKGHEIASSMTETIDQQLYFIYTNIMDEEVKIIDAVMADPNITESFGIKNLKDLYK